MRIKTMLLSVAVGLLLLSQGCLLGMDPQEFSTQAEPPKLQKKSSGLKAIFCGLSSNFGQDCYCPTMTQGYGNMFCNADGQKKGHNRRCWSGSCHCGRNGCSLTCVRCSKDLESSLEPSQVDEPGGGKGL